MQEGHSGSPALVGRQYEQGELERVLESARRGHGSLCLIAGEPGIGKTRLAEAVAATAEQAGVLVLWGRCWETPGAPPYWPWVQVLRTLIAGRAEETLARELGAHADWIAELIPELGERLPAVERPAALRSEQAPFALFDAIGTFLRNASGDDPLLIVLDDLHAADPASLALLEFVARWTVEARTVVLGAYQPAADGTRREVREILDRLARVTRTVTLDGLAEPELELLVDRISGERATRDYVQALHETSGGNPFFTEELVRLLERDPHQARAGAAERALVLPRSVKETIRRRVEQLGARAVEILETAAVIGRDFRAATLELVGFERAALIDVLDEALAAQLLTEVPGTSGRLRFRHSLVREALYADLSKGDRIHLHGKVAEALERLCGDAPEHLCELAFHFAEAAALSGADKALVYARRAGEEAMRVLAYEQAAEMFGLAFDASEVLQFDAERNAELLLSLGLARTHAADPSARNTLISAANAARGVGRADLLARAALGIHVFTLSPGDPDEPTIALLEKALGWLRDEETPLRARLLARLASALYYAPGTAARRDALVQEAVALARKIDDPATLAYVLTNAQLATWGPDTTERDLPLVEELLELTDQARNAELALVTRLRQVDYLLELDDLTGADVALEALARMAVESPEPRVRAYLPLQLARRAMIEGRYADVARLNAEATRVATALGDRLVELLAVAQLTMVRWHQGRMGEVEDAVRRFVDGAPGMPAWRAALARVYLDQGRDADARREFERLGERGFDQLPRYNGWLGMMALLADLAAQLGAEQQAAALYQLLLPFAARNVVTPYTTFDGPVTRYLGVLASTAGDHDSAEQHFAAAEDAVTRINAPLFRALTKADRARMLVARDRAGDREAASRLLEESEAIASALGLETIAGHMRRERDGLGEAHGAPVERKPAASPAAKAYVRREGDVWAFYFDGRTVRVRDSKGIRHLKLLLCNPGVEMHALQLASAESEASLPAADGADGLTVSTADDAGPVLDRQAKQAYRERLEELRRELEEAEAFDDRGRVKKLREEIDFVEHELAGAIGLGGRDRRAGSEAERARVTVTKAIRSSIRKLSEHDPHLGRELEATVRTGTFCAYEPDPRRPIAWHSEST